MPLSSYWQRKKTLYAYPAKSPTGRTTSTLIPWLKLCFWVSIKRGRLRKHCTPVQPSRTGSSTSAPVSHLTTWLIDSVCINNKNEEMPMHTMPMHPMVNLHENKGKKQSRITICLCAGGLDQGNWSLQTAWITVCQLVALTKWVIS